MTREAYLELLGAYVLLCAVYLIGYYRGAKANRVTYPIIDDYREENERKGGM